MTALALLAQAPATVGGVWLRAPHGPVRERWLQALAQQPRPLRKVPGSVDAQRWLGGLDLAATLSYLARGAAPTTQPRVTVLP